MAPRASLLVLFWLSAAAWAAQSYGTGLDGRAVDRLAPPGSRAVVLFFTASDCPIASRYIPEIERLDRALTPDGVSFWWVYPNPADTPEAVRQHQEQFHIDSSAVLDTEQRLTRMARATITPEAAVFVPAGATLHEVYRGRIDDRYLSLGRERPQATRHDLEIAIHAVLSGQPVPPPGGPAVGCSIVPRPEP